MLRKIMVRAYLLTLVTAMAVATATAFYPVTATANEPAPSGALCCYDISDCYGGQGCQWGSCLPGYNGSCRSSGSTGE
jgi:hypothetical protein